jgi:putative addiction module CopG family antidote
MQLSPVSWFQWPKRLIHYIIWACHHEQQAKFIRKRIERGGYRNASEIIGAGLRLLEQQEKQDQLKLKMLRRITSAAFDEIDRGEFVTVDPSGIDRFMTGGRELGTLLRTTRRRV